MTIKPKAMCCKTLTAPCPQYDSCLRCRGCRTSTPATYRSTDASSPPTVWWTTAWWWRSPTSAATPSSAPEEVGAPVEPNGREDVIVIGKMIAMVSKMSGALHGAGSDVRMSVMGERKGRTSEHCWVWALSLLFSQKAPYLISLSSLLFFWSRSYSSCSGHG